MIQPVFENEYIRLYHGDCLEIMPGLDIKVDAVITDLPYGITKNKWDTVIPFQQMWQNLNELVKSNGAICLFGAEPFSSALRLSNIDNFKYDWIWDKKTATGFLNSKLQPLRCIENISVFYKAQPTYNPQMRHGFKPYVAVHTGQSENYNYTGRVITISNGDRYPTQYIDIKRSGCTGLHPTQKPVELLEYLIKTYTNEGDTVLDFTAGSGSTGIACYNLKRKCILIEKELKYVNVIIERFKSHYTQQTIL